MANKSGTYYKGKSGRGAKVRVSSKGNGRKYASVKTRGRTRIKAT